jgi:hypothetical protein
LTSLPRSFPAQRLTISLTLRSFLERKPLRQQRSPPSEPLPLAYERWLAFTLSQELLPADRDLEVGVSSNQNRTINRAVTALSLLRAVCQFSDAPFGTFGEGI